MKIAILPQFLTSDVHEILRLSRFVVVRRHHPRLREKERRARVSDVDPQMCEDVDLQMCEDVYLQMCEDVDLQMCKDVDLHICEDVDLQMW